ncbi:Bdr family repetitive protein (plasmid) [Borrelia puertoricensis]|uniref:Bdr family repetitive protein n=1 Tax=Borrelia puertoricensis TaxID=2756107 RepID=UPI003EC151A2
MGNLAYKIYRTEDLKNEFLNKGFTEEAVNFILLHNDNSKFEVLREKMNSLEQQIINVESNLKKDIEFTKVEFKRDISNLDIKIDNVEKNLQKEITNLDIKIDNVEKNLQKEITNLDIKIDNVEKNLQKEITNLDIKIDNVEKNLQKDISNIEKNLQKEITNLDIKIDSIEKNLLKEIQNNNAVLLEKLNTGNRIIYLMIIGIGIFFPIISSLINKYFIN